MGDLDEAKKYQKYHDTLNKYRKELKDFEDAELQECERIEKLIKVASTALSNKDFERLDKVMPNLDELIRLTGQKMNIIRLEGLIRSFSKKLDQFEARGIDVMEERAFIEVAMDEFNEKNFVRAKDTLKKVKARLSQKAKEAADAEDAKEGGKKKGRKRRKVSKEDEEKPAEEKEPEEKGDEAPKEEVEKPADPIESDDSSDSGPQDSDPQEEPAEEEKPEETPEDAKPEEVPAEEPAKEEVAEAEGELKKKALEDEVNANLKLAWSRIKDGEAIGSNMEEAKDILNKCRELVAEDNFDEAKTQMDACLASIDKYTQIHKEIQTAENLAKGREVLIELQELVDALKSDYKTKELDDQLYNISKSLDEGQTEEAYSASVDVLAKCTDQLAQFKNQLHETAMNAIKQVRDRLKELKEREIDIAEAKEIFSSAEPAFKEEKFTEVMEIAQKALEKAQEIEDAVVAKKAKECLEKTETLLNTMKEEGADVESFVPKVDQLKTGLQENAFKEVLEEGETLYKTLYYMKSERMRGTAEEKLKALGEQLKNLKAIEGVQHIGEIEGKLTQASTAFQTNEIDECMKLCADIEEAMGPAMKENAQIKLDTLKQQVEFLDSVSTPPEEPPAEGAPPTPQAWLESAQAAFDAEDWLKCMNDSITGIAAAGEKTGNVTSDRIVTFQTLLGQVKSLVEPEAIAPAEQTFQDAALSFQNGDHTLANQKCDEGIGALNTLLETKAKELLELKKQAMEQAAASAQGMDLTAAQQVLDEASAAIEGGKSADAFGMLNNFDATLQQALQTQAQQVLVTVQNEIAQAKEAGLKTEEAENAFKVVTDHFRNNQFVEMIAAVNDVNLALANAKRFAEVVGDVQLTRTKLQEAATLGFEVTKVSETLQSARPLIEAKEWDKALEASRSAREMAENLIANKDWTEKMNSIKTRVDILLASEIGAVEKDIINKGYEDIVTVYNSYDFQALEGKVMDFEKTLSDLQNEANQGAEAKQKVEAEFQAQTAGIEQMRGSGVDIVAAEVSLNQAQDAFNQGDLEKAQQLIDQSKTELQQAHEQHQKLLEAITAAKTLLKAAKEQGKDTTQAAEAFSGIGAALDGKQYDKVLELCNTVTQLLEQPAAEGATPEPTPAPEPATEPAPTTGSDIPTPKEIPNMAGMSDDDKRNLMLEEVGKAQSVLDEIKMRALPSTEAQGYFDRIIPTMQSGDLDGAVQLAVKCREVAKDLLENYEPVKDRVQELRKQLSEIRSMGIEPPNSDGMIDEAEKKLADGNLEGASKLLDDAIADMKAALP